MNNVKWYCPYCPQEFRTSLYTRHIFSKHFEEVFSPSTPSGKANRATFSGHTSGCGITLNFPCGKNTQSSLPVCLGCMTGVRKEGILVKHFQKPMDHTHAHLDAFKKIQERLFKPVVEVEDVSGASVLAVPVAPLPPPAVIDWKPFQAVIWELMKDEIIARSSEQKARQHLGNIRECLENKDTISLNEFDDLGYDLEDEETFASIPKNLKATLPFSVDPKELIDLFVIDSQKALYTKFLPDGRLKTKPSIPKDPEPILEPKVEPIPEPKVEPKPLPQTSAYPIQKAQTFQQPQTPSFPSLILDTKVRKKEAVKRIPLTSEELAQKYRVE